VLIHVLQGERPMAKDNKTIGKFKLKGIKRAMSGVPQIEVTFDLDANGILKVSAKDLDTGKEQSITITANERMSDDEIEQAIRDAQEYSGSDQLRREAAELKNDAQSLVVQMEQTIKDKGKEMDKVKKKQLKADCAALQKQISKIKLDKVTQEEIDSLREAKEQLEQSGAM
ncbi:MAG: Hsp70 family protein, partial [Lachnospiraceae bacterium]|nr:Hsp70 family protein [Lachnospiraceae bacterium]